VIPKHVNIKTAILLVVLYRLGLYIRREENRLFRKLFVEEAIGA